MFGSLLKSRVSFLIGGVQKGGTTALAHFLRQHPRIVMPEGEVHFFDREDRDWIDQDYRDYHRQFPRVWPWITQGEKTPIYSYWDGAMERAKEYNPAIKFILSLRSPVDRAFSHWRMERARGHETLPFSEAIREGRRRVIDVAASENDLRRFSYVERGFYAGQIRRAQAICGPDRVLILTSDELRASHAQQLDRICDFLEVPRFKNHPAAETIRPVLKNAPRIEPDGQDRMTPSDRAYLLDLFREDIFETQELSGLDLSAWLAPETHAP